MVAAKTGFAFLKVTSVPSPQSAAAVRCGWEAAVKKYFCVGYSQESAGLSTELCLAVEELIFDASQSLPCSGETAPSLSSLTVTMGRV